MKRTATTIVLLTLLAFAGVVSLVSIRLRGKVRGEMLRREALILNAVAQREACHGDEAVLDLVLRIVDMEGVVGVRVFDAKGVYLRALPDNLISSTLIPSVRDKPGSTSTRLAKDVWLGSLYADPFGELGDRSLSLLYVTVPIRDESGNSVKGYAEFLMDGRATAEAFQRLDHDLLRQALAAFFAGGLPIVAIILLSIHQLAKKNRELAAANRELSLHARTAAIGAVSSHLFHGLKNALSSLHAAIQENGNMQPDVQVSTLRIRQMVQEVIDVISEEQYGITYDLSASEILELVQAKSQALAEAVDVRVETSSNGERSFTNRTANLILLALENLVNNAIEASDAGQTVTCQHPKDDDGSRFVITDLGHGIPETRRNCLFEPGKSTKANGSGIGLSISHQLCRHFGGEIRLVETGPGGTTIELVIQEQ